MRNQHSFPFTVLLQVLLPSLKCGLRALEPPSCSHQLAISPLISTSEFPGDLQPSPDPYLSVLITKLKPHGFGQPPASLQEYPLCPKHSICITMLGHPQTLSGSPFPFSSPKHNPREPGTSPRDFLCPYAQDNRVCTYYSSLFLNSVLFLSLKYPVWDYKSVETKILSQALETTNRSLRAKGTYP